MKNIPSLGIPRTVGYSLLLLSIINWADILLPPQLLNPTWELSTVGAIVESVPLFLFSLVFIFYGEGIHRNKSEKLLVRIISHACLPIAFAFALLLLVAATSTVRINQQIDIQVGEVFGQQMEQLNQLEEQIDDASSQQIDEILESQGIEIDVDQSVTRKEQLLDYLAEGRQAIQQQSSDSRARRKRSTMKSSVKWAVGAIVSGATLAYIWVLTKWARVAYRVSGSKGKK